MAKALDSIGTHKAFNPDSPDGLASASLVHQFPLVGQDLMPDQVAES